MGAKSLIYSFSCVILSLWTTLSFGQQKPISAKEYIDLWKNEAIHQMIEHRIPASITLAQGLLESGNGNSRLAKEGNNHFGIKCHNDWAGERIFEDDETNNECFRKYKSAKESFEDHSIFLKRKRYETLFSLNPDDYKGWAHGLKECGYATNPKYPQLLINLIEQYALHELDREAMKNIKNGTTPNISPHNSKQDNNSTNITLANNREIGISGNRIKFIRAKHGDTPASIAKDLDIGAWQIKKYNDIGDSHVFQGGELVYIQPKRNKGRQAFYTVKKGDTLRAISQEQGIKLSKLYKRNGLNESSILSIGQKIKLK